MMEKVSFSDVLGKAWFNFIENWWVWLLMVLPVQLLNSYLLTQIPHIEDTIDHPNPILFFVVSLVAFFIYSILTKFNLLLVQQPEWVRANLWQALSLACKDNLIKRIAYFIAAFLVTILLVVVATVVLGVLVGLLIGAPSIGFGFGVVFSFGFLIFFHPLYYIRLLFVFCSSFPYIVQETLSEDNQGTPLSLLACMIKSITMFNTYKGAQMILIFISVGLFVLYRRELEGMMGSNLDWREGIALIIQSFLCLIPMVIGSVWADELTADDDEIADFGDY